MDHGWQSFEEKWVSSTSGFWALLSPSVMCSLLDLVLSGLWVAGSTVKLGFCLSCKSKRFYFLNRREKCLNICSWEIAD